ncbi:RNF17 protein, partial [Centropus bengalensis]|nr:RNF17 protein [Centropus bengalensis]
KVFPALVTCVGTDGTIYIIPKSFETEINKMLTEIQRNFKCHALLEPHCWKRGEACLVRKEDNVWHRGQVVEISSSALEVQFVDIGCIARFPPRDVYPTTLYTDIPPFCIPCQLHKAAPIGNVWQAEALHCLQDLLLTDEEVDVHVQELPDNPRGKLSISLYFSEISVAAFMAYQKYCVAEDPQDLLQLMLEQHDLVRSSYELPPLPIPGAFLPVKVTHLVSPNEVYISLDLCKHLCKPPATEGDASAEEQWESLKEALKWCSENVELIPLLKHFQTGMPCLAEYHDGLWYRAKIISVEKSSPLQILIQFVDYGNFSIVSASSLRQMPYEVLKFPVEAAQVLLAGFKPPLKDKSTRRIPYAPQWSEEALWAMIECVEGKQLLACILALSPEITISLYDDEKNLVHMKLIELGLADLHE